MAVYRLGVGSDGQMHIVLATNKGRNRREGTRQAQKNSFDCRAYNGGLEEKYTRKNAYRFCEGLWKKFGYTYVLASHFFSGTSQY